MTLGHFFYVPGVLCLGLLIGYILGSRAAEVARADREQQDRRRAARHSAREDSAGVKPAPPTDAAADKPGGP